MINYLTGILVVLNPVVPDNLSVIRLEDWSELWLRNCFSIVIVDDASDRQKLEGWEELKAAGSRTEHSSPVPVDSRTIHSYRCKGAHTKYKDSEQFCVVLFLLRFKNKWRTGVWYTGSECNRKMMWRQLLVVTELFDIVVSEYREKESALSPA